MTIIKMSDTNKSTIRMMDTKIELADNAMLRHRPDLFDQWDFEKNDLIGLDVYKVTRGSDKYAWWICPKCDSDYESRISNRFNRKDCPYCRGLKVNHTNSLVSLYPEIMKQWHPVKNIDLNPHQITTGSTKKAWWIGDCNHEWESTIRTRTKLGVGCPYCANNPKALKGFNDMWTTNPELASLLANPEDGYKFTQGSGGKADWKCPYCNSIIEKRTIHYIKRHMRIPCINCSDGFSFSEKFLYHLLIENKIDFEGEKCFKWSGKKRYDFYLKKYNWIIEVHGIQHYENIVFHDSNKRGIKYQNKNDNEKIKLAKENGISKYTVLDGRESNSSFLVKSILDSDLSEIIQIKNIEEVERNASSSFLITACKMWNKDISVNEISKELKVYASTVRNYLKRGSDIGLCNYSSEESRRRNKENSSAPKKQGRKVVQLTRDLEFVKEWESLAEINRQTGCSSDYISKCCRGIINEVVLGYRWYFKEDYEREVETNVQKN